MRTARANLGTVLLSWILALGVGGEPLPAPSIAPIAIEPGPVKPPRTRWPQPISAGEIQRLARENTPLAGIIDADTKDRPIHRWLDWKGTSRARTILLDQARDLTAEELRNQNVGTALELFWKLTVNTERCRLLALGTAELHSQLGRLDEAIAKELKAPRDRDELVLKISKLKSDEIALRAGLETLNDQLALLVGWDQPIAPAYQPQSALQVIPEAIDPEQAVTLGLHARADLKLMRMLETNLDARTLPVVQRWMSAINPLLGPIPLKSVLELILRAITLAPDKELQVTDVRKQVEQLRLLRERQTRSDILRQVELVQMKHQAAMQVQHRLEIQRIRLGAMQEKFARELASEAEVGPLRLEVWGAEADRVQAAIDWELARVELRKLQGLLTTHPVEEACAPPPSIPMAPTMLSNPFPQAFTPPPPGAVFTPQTPKLPVPRETLPLPRPAGQFPPAFASPSSGAS